MVVAVQIKDCNYIAREAAASASSPPPSSLERTSRGCCCCCICICICCCCCCCTPVPAPVCCTCYCCCCCRCRHCSFLIAAAADTVTPLHSSWPQLQLLGVGSWELSCAEPSGIPVVSRLLFAVSCHFFSCSRLVSSRLVICCWLALLVVSCLLVWAKSVWAPLSLGE